MTLLPSHLTEEDYQEMKRLKSEAGWSIGKIAGKFKLSKGRVRSFLKGVPSLHEQERKSAHSPDREEIHQLLKDYPQNDLLDDA